MTGTLMAWYICDACKDTHPKGPFCEGWSRKLPEGEHWDMMSCPYKAPNDQNWRLVPEKGEWVRDKMCPRDPSKQQEE